MKYLGEIVNYGGKDGTHNYGFIEPLIGVRAANVFFHKDSIIVGDLLRSVISPEEVGTLVLFECDGNVNSYGKRKATLVMSLYGSAAADFFEDLDPTAKENDVVFESVFLSHPEKYLSDENYVFGYFYKDVVVKQYLKKCLPKIEDKNYIARYLKYLNGRKPSNKPAIFSFDFNGQPYKDIAALLSLFWTDIPQQRMTFVEKYPSLLTEPGIVKWVNIREFEYMKEHNIPLTDDQLLEIVKNNRDISNYYTCNLTLDDLVDRPVLLDALKSDVILNLIKNMSIDELIPILKHLQANKHPKIVIHILSRITQADDLSRLWEHFSSSMKIRAIIYYSNSKKENIFLPEILVELDKRENNLLVKGLLSLSQIPFYNNPKEKDALFNVFHNNLMEYLIKEFNETNSSKNEISTLIDKCVSHQEKDIFYFCDARPWPNTDGVFCPDGPYHFCGRSKCDYFKTLNFIKIEDREYREEEYKSLSDMLININYNPDIRIIKENPSRPNYPGYYPYMIAGFVNQLIQLKPHIKCRCGRRFSPRFDYAKKVEARISPDVYDCSIFSEEENVNQEEHDKGVYLNFCISCRSVIDSRECKIQDGSKYWLCMACGSSLEYGYKTGKLKCPNCGTESLLDLNFSFGQIECNKCGHNKYNTDWKIFK